MTPEDARERFRTEPVARLATVTPDGRPHVVPVTFALDGDRIVTAVDAKPKAGTHLARLANVRANARVALLVDHYHADWRRLWWARADGTARIVENGPELAWAFGLLGDRYDQYATVGIVGPAIVVDVDRWLGWSATGP